MSSEEVDPFLISVLATAILPSSSPVERSCDEDLKIKMGVFDHQAKNLHGVLEVE